MDPLSSSIVDSEPTSAAPESSIQDYTIVPDDTKLDEENWPWYTPESFYPVNIGDVIHSRYKVLYKIGFGTTSTVWICRDLEHDTYVCMKSMVQDYPSAPRELAAYKLLSEKAKEDPSNARFVRQLLDHFQLQHGEYSYDFFIHEPLGVSLDMVIFMCYGGYPLEFIDAMAADILRGLAFIHSVGIVHADISTGNIHLTLPNNDTLKILEDEETRHPSPRKYIGQTTIFGKRRFQELFDSMVGDSSVPVLCDFSEARYGKERYAEIIQPLPFRAPEVILHIAWKASVDVWSFGCMLWYLATGESLFPWPEEDEEDDDDVVGVQLATMSALLGPPPAGWMKYSGPRALKFFNEDGSCKYPVPNQTLESRLASAFEGRETPTAEVCAGFLGFIRRVLVWDHLARPLAKELLEDPWITGQTASI